MFLAEAHWRVTDWSDCRPLSAESQCGFDSQTRNLTCVFFPSRPRLETEPSRCNEVRVEHSHWSRSLQIMIIVETCYAGAKVYAITTHFKARQNCVPITVLLLHDKWLPCTERIYYRHPYVIKTQVKARKISLTMNIWCLPLCLYGMRELATAGP